ncbi:hypothetical protein [Methylobacter sp. BlB1]|jgi:hypothetical protein|uniref:condensin complex protein MksE n=1 Tax=unclassified Methylobacter TaxID=2635283 RepID=UPI001895B2EC|nr:hypothetical protein [Methylobacter sp. BlB1]MBF6650094.1 hypothetical protein [Methylobacter sp. BlB1]
MTLDLKQLAQLQTLFKALSSGIHINRLQDTELWMDLEKHYAGYESLFSALGFALVMDGRGFAYFKTEQASSYTGKLSRRLALFLMLLFEYQADQGLHLFQFQQWRVDGPLLEALSQHYHALLEAEEMASAQALSEILDRAARVGFTLFEDGSYWLLPAVHRYLDLFEELAQADKPDLDETVTASSPLDALGDLEQSEEAL